MGYVIRKVDNQLPEQLFKSPAGPTARAWPFTD